MNTLILDLEKGNPAMILDLSKEAPNLSRLKGVLRWEPHPAHPDCKKEGFDLDIFSMSLNSAGKVTNLNQVVYFKQKSNINGSITVPIDNQTGQGEDDEYILVKVKELPSDMMSHEVFVFIHDAVERNHHFGMVAGAHFDMIDEDTGRVLAQYNITQQFSGKTALHVGSLKRFPDGHFEFHPVGLADVADPQVVLQAYC